MTEDQQDDFMTIAELSRRTGLSEASIRSDIAKKRYVEGVHFERRGKRRIMMNRTAINRSIRDKNLTQ